MVSLFEATDGFEVVPDAAQSPVEQQVDLVILDLTDAEPQDETSWTAPLVVALVDDEQSATQARSAGAQAILARTAPPAQLEAAVRAVVAGLEVVDPGLDLGPSGAATPSTPWGDTLTAREQDVLALLAEGASNREIAERLEVSPNTAKFHVNAILSKLGARSRTEAVVLAARMGMVHL